MILWILRATFAALRRLLRSIASNERAARDVSELVDEVFGAD